MKLTKRSERVKHSGRLVTCSIPAIGGKVTKLNRYYKWIEVSLGSLRDELTLWEVRMPDGKTAWALIDILDQLACPFIPDKNEALTFLNAEGWKVEVERDDDEDEEVEEE